MEYFFPEDINISLVSEATTAVINKQTTTNFTDYKKHLVQFDQKSKDTPDYLFFNIRGSGTTSTNPEGYLVFYGVKNFLDSVPPQIYDHDLETGMFKYDGGNMKMNMNLDLNGFSLINSGGDYFYLKGFYNIANSPIPELIRGTDGKPIFNIPCSCYLVEVFVLITSVAANNDYKFKLDIHTTKPRRTTTSLSSTNNSKFYRFMDFTKPYFRAQKASMEMSLFYDKQPNRVKFPTATFLFKFFRESNFS